MPQSQGDAARFAAICSAHEGGKTRRQLAEEYGLSVVRIGQIINKGKRLRHGVETWARHPEYREHPEWAVIDGPRGINSLDLPWGTMGSRIFNALLRANILSVDDLRPMTQGDILDIPNIGVKGRAALMDALSRMQA